MSGTSTSHGDSSPRRATGRRAGTSGTAILCGAMLLATATGSHQALAQPAPTEPTATPGAAPETGTPTTGAPFDQATPQQTARATEAYKAGVEALDGQRFDEALAKFRESYGIVASPNSRLMVVRALAEAGKDVEAYEEAVATLQECEAAAAKDPKYEKATVGAREELTALEGKVARVTVTVSKAPEGATLTVAGQPIDPSRWGQVIVVAPGEVWVTLTTADGEETRKVTVAPGGTESVEIAPPEPKAVAKAPKKKKKKVVKEEGGFEWTNRRMWAYVAGGIGVVGFANMGIFGMLSNSRMIRLEDQCDRDDNCDPALVDEANAGKTYTALANVGLIVGIVGVSAGAGLFVWDLVDPDERDSAAIVKPRLSVGAGSLAVSGSF